MFVCVGTSGLRVVLLRCTAELFSIDFWLGIERCTNGAPGVSLLHWSHPICAIT